MKFLRLLKSDFQRAVFSYSFLICMLTVTVLIVSSAYTQIETTSSLHHLLSRGMKGNGLETVILQVLPLIPFGMTFAYEWKEKAYLFYISKVGPERYILSKMIITAVSGLLLVLLGTALAIPILRVLAPEHMIADLEVPDFYVSFFREGQFALGYFMLIFNYALTSCLSSICGVWFSTYVPSPLAVLASPTLINFTLIRIGPIYTIPGIFDKYIFFNPVFWINATYPTESAAVQIGYHFGNVMMIFVILAFFAVRKTKRRVLNG